jgi:hypothetical protein
VMGPCRLIGSRSSIAVSALQLRLSSSGTRMPGGVLAPSPSTDVQLLELSPVPQTLS